MKVVEKHLPKCTYIRQIYLGALFTTAAVHVGRNIALTKNLGICSFNSGSTHHWIYSDLMLWGSGEADHLEAPA